VISFRSSPLSCLQDGGYSALHHAVFRGRLAIAKRLLERGADPWTLRDTAGKTALDYARKDGNSELVALLSEPRYAMKTDRGKRIERSGRAVLGTRRRLIAGRRRTNGGDSPWDAAERTRRPTCLAYKSAL
jgi:hypothetical protein